MSLVAAGFCSLMGALTALNPLIPTWFRAGGCAACFFLAGLNVGLWLVLNGVVTS